MGAWLGKSQTKDPVSSMFKRLELGPVKSNSLIVWGAGVPEVIDDRLAFRRRAGLQAKELEPVSWMPPTPGLPTMLRHEAIGCFAMLPKQGAGWATVKKHGAAWPCAAVCAGGSLQEISSQSPFCMRTRFWS